MRHQSIVRQMVWRFEAFGFGYEQAINLAARVFDLRTPPKVQWTEKEIEDLLDLRELVRRELVPH